MDAERFLVGDEDLGIELAFADQRAAAGVHRLAAVGAAQPRLRADGQAVREERSAPGEFQLDPVDARDRRAVRGVDAALQVHRDRRRFVPGELFRGDAAVEGDDQVAPLGSLGARLDREEREQGDRREDRESPRASPHQKPYLENLKLQ